MKLMPADRKQNVKKKRERGKEEWHLMDVLLLIMTGVLWFFLWFETHLLQGYY
ncbi:hypothetical protein A15U_04651 [Escherichia coli KTE210]|jgi:hypothetical protein|nr:hypothetical protein A15U_04651 [Escherichia coli KTE210]